MTSYVRCQDYLRFLRYWEVIEEGKVKGYTNRIEERRREYESNWFNKLFGFKFDNSYDRYTWDDYDGWAGRRLKDTVAEINRCEYHIKVKDLTIEPKWSDSFYKYCKDNGIPY